MMLITTTGGESGILTTTDSFVKTSRITHTGAEVLGETNTGGGTERPESFMTQNTSLRKAITDGGTESLMRKIFLRITWTFLLLGLGTTWISLVSGGEISQNLFG